MDYFIAEIIGAVLLIVLIELLFKNYTVNGMQHRKIKKVPRHFKYV